jgi:catechol 2,3-dioxygenase-like lactoylglutathione lyase family enzyme
MLGHLSFGVSDLDRSSAFYDAVMTALGFRRVWTSPNGVGYGLEPNQDKLALFPRTGVAPPGPGFHLAFDAPDRAAVDAFHAAALASGGTCDGPPGLRPHYGETYYAAFVIDPDGYRLEAVHQ